MTQGERQNFLWRPNDNSITTITRYDAEAEHWQRAFKNAESKHKGASLIAILGTIGLFISLVFSLASLILMMMISLIRWFRQLIKN